MARKSTRRPAARPASTSRRSSRPNSSSSKSTGSERERIIDSFMALLAEKSIEQIGLAEIAEGAKISLADLRNLFGSPLAILAAQMKDTDRKVLAGSDADMADEPARERLFDALMRRLEVLAPHKAAVGKRMI